MKKVHCKHSLTLLIAHPFLHFLQMISIIRFQWSDRFDFIWFDLVWFHSSKYCMSSIPPPRLSPFNQLTRSWIKWHFPSKFLMKRRVQCLVRLQSSESKIIRIKFRANQNLKLITIYVSTQPHRDCVLFSLRYYRCIHTCIFVAIVDNTQLGH